MGIKIYTYSNPYELSRETFWNEIQNSPHFCVSQTMVNGFESILDPYGKRKTMTTIRNLLNTLYEDWEDMNVRVRQIMEVDNAIHELSIEEQNGNIRNSLEYNTKSIAKCIRIFEELGLEADSFDVSEMNPVQKYLVEIYRYISKRKKTSFRFNRIMDKAKIDDALLSALRKKRNNKDNPYNDLNKETVVIHGIHQFSPAMLCAIEDISKYKNVVLLFNYQEQYRQIYQTWLNIYALFDSRIIISKDNEFKPVSLFTDSYSCNTLADNIGTLSNGNPDIKSGILDKLEVIEFENLTEFAGYCAALFENARITNKKNGSHSPVLYDMTEQLYSASGKVNDILRAYFPEQFGERHFLDYPIGHFFVAVVEMWDNDRKCVKTDEMSLIKDCLSSGIISETRRGQLLNTFNIVESYIEKENTLEGIINGLKKLRKYVGTNEQQLKRIGYLNCTKSEIDELRSALAELNQIIINFFSDFSVGGDNFNRFYKRIHNFIVKKTQDMDSLDAKMKEVINRLLVRMNNIDLPDTGTFNCLKQTMSFYLSQDDTLVRGANWIVRDFEQIDGDILRSAKQKAENTCYHFCCLSDKDICAARDERLPWPLDIQFFEYGYEPIDRNYQIFLKSKMEFKNFKRYALLYGLEFNRLGCKLSYVKNENRKDNELYHLLKMLGLRVTKYHNTVENNYVPYMKYTDVCDKYDPNFTLVDKLRYVICPYRFALESLVQEKTIYRERFLTIWYFRVMLQNKIEKDYAGKNMDENELKRVILAKYAEMDDKFHISNEYEKTQIIAEMYKYLRNYLAQFRRMKNISYEQTEINQLKNDFLIKFEKFIDTAKQTDLSKVLTEERFFKDNKSSVCMYCASKDICLRNTNFKE